MYLAFQLALRSIWRQRRRNALVIFAIVVSVGGVFVMNAFARGMEQDFVESSVANLRGHLKIYAPKQREEPGLRHTISSALDWSKLDQSAVNVWTPRTRSPVAIMSEYETRGAELVGIEPASETHSFFKDLQVEGESLISANDPSLLIGRKLAAELKTGVNRRVVVLLEGPEGNTIERGFRVKGLFSAPNSRYEEAYVFTGLRALQTIVGVEAFTDISVHLNELSDLAVVKSELESEFPALTISSWAELDPFIGEMYSYISFTLYILIAVFMCTLVFGLINALVTAVLERVREFGMLRAVGMKSRLVVLQIVIECLIIMVVALLIGLAVGLLIVFWLSDGIDLTAFAEGVEAFGMNTRMAPHLVMKDFVTLTVASLLLGLMASYFPARRIIKTSVLQSLRGS